MTYSLDGPGFTETQRVRTRGEGSDGSAKSWSMKESDHEVKVKVLCDTFRSPVYPGDVVTL